MTFLDASQLVKDWLPWATIFGIAWRLYHTGKSSVNEWAEKLLSNHLFHLQLSLDRQTELLERIADKD